MATRWNKHDSVHVATESAHHVLLQTCNGYVAQVVRSPSPSTLRDASLAPNENRGGIIIAYPNYQLRKSVLAAWPLFTHTVATVNWLLGLVV